MELWSVILMRKREDDSVYTKPSVGVRRARRRRQNKVARAFRKANR
jgi:hypothetical protein